MKITNIVLCMLLATFTGRCLIQWVFPYYFNMPILSTLMVLVGITCSLYCVYYSFENLYRTGDKFLISLFVIYSMFVYYHLFVDPQIKIENMLHVPDNESAFFKESLTALLAMLSVPLCIKKLNYKRFSILTLLIVSLFLILYFTHIDYKIYLITAEVVGSARETIVPLGYVDGFTIGNNIGLIFACNLFMSDKWTKQYNLNIIITVVICIFCFVIQFFVFQRGPVIFLLTSLFFYLFSRGHLSVKGLLSLSFIIIILFLFGEEFISLLRNISSASYNRFLSISSDGGSGRIGSQDSEYASALKQIVKDPFFGSFPRTLAPARYGHYPHNLILELLMTFGLVFSLPLFILMFLAVKQSYKIIKERRNESLFAIWFIYILSTHLTSGTILNDTSFWFTFTFVLSSKELVLLNNNDI